MPVKLEKPKATLAFEVKDAAGHPVKDATVRVDGVAGEQMTDASGVARFEGLEDGKAYRYTVHKDTYQDATGDNVTLPADGLIVPVKLEKQPATLAFEVKDADGHPVKGAVVAVDGKREMTGTDGKAVIAGLEVGTEYSYTVEKDGYTPKSAKVTLTADLPPVEVTLEKLQVYLNVFVVDQDLKPIEGVKVDVIENGAVDTANKLTNVNGLATFPVPVGDYDISVKAKAKGYKDASSGKVRVEKNGLDFTFVLQKEDQNNGSPSPVESELLAGVEMYPNPASVATMLYGVENAKRITVYTVTGVQVLSQAVHGEKEMRVSVEHMAEGVYVVIVQTESGESKALKLVVRR